MKRNLILTVAVAVFMVATTVAQAADVTYSGEFRPRYEIDNDATNNTNPSPTFSTRVRLNAKVNVNANTTGFLQFQSVGTWGAADIDTTFNDGTRQSLGGGNDQASDVLADVGFHQAYFTFKNLAGQAVDMKIGRQQVVVDGHRLFGHTGWLQGAETKDALRLTHSAGNHVLNYTYIQADENDAIGTYTDQDESVHFFHAQTQGVMGGALSAIFTITDDSNANASGESENVWYTIGARQKGKLGGLDYRVEFYHQFGDGGGIATTCACGITGATSTGPSVDRDAQMVGLRVGKTFKNAAGSPSLTFWFDSLTGVDDDDAAGGDWGTFDIMYDTGHKFYGFMDAFLNRTGANTGFYGLEDYALKFKTTVKPGWTLKADWHHFRTQTNISGSDADTVVAADASLGGAMDEDLGTELDLTLVNKYDANTKIAIGYSHYFTTTTFSQLNGGAGSLANNAGSNQNDDADWFYVQMHTKF